MVFKGGFLCMGSLQRKGPRGGGERAASRRRANAGAAAVCIAAQPEVGPGKASLNSNEYLQSHCSGAECNHKTPVHRFDASKGNERSAAEMELPLERLINTDLSARGRTQMLYF